MSNLRFATSERYVSAVTFPVHEKAKAKVNLCLHVKGKRADGYHELDSLVVFSDVCDDVSFSPGSVDDLQMDGPFACAVDGENLIFKAKRAVSDLLCQEISGEFRLRKNIPVAAGLGGGSSDAAATIRALIYAYRPDDVAPELLTALAAKVGADVPVCLHHHAAWMRGLGERVTPIKNLCGLPALLVNPGIKLSTRDVFSALNAEPCEPGFDMDQPGLATNWTCAHDAAEALACGRNDLEPPAMQLQPAIAEVLEILRDTQGCLLARLSGSGPTCFGIFNSTESAQQAEKILRKRYSSWWLASTTLS